MIIMANILIVDDEQEIADLIEIYLKNENFTVYKYYSRNKTKNKFFMSQSLPPGFSASSIK